MDTEILNKPVNMQNLSHALAKVKADYIGIINDLSSNINTENSDWEENDSTSNAYILNKPAIKAGEGENGVLIGQTEQVEAARVFTLYLTGAGGATTLTYTTEDDLSGISASLFKSQGILFNEAASSTPYRYITDIDTTQKTISVNAQFSSSAITNQKMLLYYQYKMSYNSSVAEGERTRAVGARSHAEGNNTIAIGTNSHAEGATTKAVGMYSHAEGNTSIAKGLTSHAEGSHTTASGSGSHSEGIGTRASGTYSHAEGSYTTASNNNSHAEGYYTVANGDTSHAEGVRSYAAEFGAHAEGAYGAISISISGKANSLNYTILDNNSIEIDDANMFNNLIVFYNSKYYPLTALNISNGILTGFTLEETLNASADFNDTVTLDIGNYAKARGSHAEGGATYAKGNLSHAEGLQTKAFGTASHAEGQYTVASGRASHAQGIGTTAQSRSQHVFGEYNILDTGGDADSRGNYVEIIGNGTSDTRSNAYTLDWQGNGWYAGKLTVGTGPTENMDVATKQYVDAATAGITTNLSGLTDTTISSPTNGQILVYDSTTSKWINSTASFVTSSEVNTIVQTAVASALANYGDGDTATYGYVNVNEEEY